MRLCVCPCVTVINWLKIWKIFGKNKLRSTLNNDCVHTSVHLYHVGLQLFLVIGKIVKLLCSDLQAAFCQCFETCSFKNLSGGLVSFGSWGASLLASTSRCRGVVHQLWCFLWSWYSKPWSACSTQYCRDPACLVLQQPQADSMHVKNICITS